MHILSQPIGQGATGVVQNLSLQDLLTCLVSTSVYSSFAVVGFVWNQVLRRVLSAKMDGNSKFRSEMMGMS